GAHRVVAEVGLRLKHQDGAIVADDFNRVVDLRKLTVRKFYVNDWSCNLEDFAGSGHGVISSLTPGVRGRLIKHAVGESCSASSSGLRRSGGIRAGRDLRHFVRDLRLAGLVQ